jgi:hypothetical protein
MKKNPGARKSETHFEQIPLKVVKKIVEPAPKKRGLAK